MKPLEPYFQRYVQVKKHKQKKEVEEQEDNEEKEDEQIKEKKKDLKKLKKGLKKKIHFRLPWVYDEEISPPAVTQQPLKLI